MINIVFSILLCFLIVLFVVCTPETISETVSEPIISSDYSIDLSTVSSAHSSAITVSSDGTLVASVNPDSDTIKKMHKHINNAINLCLEINDLSLLREMKHVKLAIYTISGEKVISLNHSDVENGSKFWNLRSVNNQEVVPGLYIYVVEDTNQNNERNKFIGKFAIVR